MPSRLVRRKCLSLLDSSQPRRQRAWRRLARRRRRCAQRCRGCDADRPAARQRPSRSAATVPSPLRVPLLQSERRAARCVSCVHVRVRAEAGESEVVTCEPVVLPLRRLRRSSPRLQVSIYIYLYPSPRYRPMDSPSESAATRLPKEKRGQGWRTRRKRRCRSR